MKNIYICHQYYDKSHFEAIYKCAEKNGYLVKDYIVLGKRHIINRMGKKIIYEHDVFGAIKECVESFLKILSLRKLHNEILIVGLAPYDTLMNRYERVFSNNKAIYFTSWQFWDGSKFPRGRKDNKAKFERILSKNFVGSACVSMVTERQVKLFTKNTSVVNHSIDVSAYRKRTVDRDIKETRKYLYLGRLEDVKNIDLILDWLSINPNANVEISFAGSGSLQEKLVDAEKFDNRIRFLGRLPKTEIKNKLCSYDFLLLPSKEEPFGIVLIEALAAGVPCIVSDALGPDEIIEDGKVGFKFGLEQGIQGFSVAMERSLSITPESYWRMVENCIENSNQYSPEEIFRRWEKLFLLCE